MNPRRTLLLLLFLLAPGFLGAKTFKDLPDWAQAGYLASRQAPRPTGADQWVLLDRTEFAYTGDGEIALHRYRLVEVLARPGVDAGVFLLTGLGGGASKVKKLKGWNLRPDGDLVKLDSDSVVAVERPGDSTGIENTRLTGARLDRVVEGSLVAFESLQVMTHPAGPASIAWVMEPQPVFRWELRAVTQGGWFRNLKQVSHRMEFSHFSPWIPAPIVVPDVSIAAENVPALPAGEGASPSMWAMLPRVTVRFMDPDLKGVPALDSWNGIASWAEAVFLEKAPPTPVPVDASRSRLDTLRGICQWMRTQLTYKQVYLSPDRGWVPLSASDVARRRYGDCKDLASCLIGAARAQGFEAHPVLARIPFERIEEDDPVHLACFNHVIAAIALPQTLHLDAEVETPAGRFLLVDPTARLTPLGKLPLGHAGGRLLICLKGAGVWVEVPESALEQPRMEADLDGKASMSGGLQGRLRLTEWADSRDLRSSALDMSPLEFQHFLFSQVLALPSNARLQVVRHSLPLDLEQPFQVEVDLEVPKAFDLHGAEWDLQALGIFRMVPPLIQKAGQARRSPISTTGRDTFVAKATLAVPVPLAPLLPHREGSSPFHAFQWEAQARPGEGGGCTLTLRFQNARKPATFGYAAREEGLSAWMKDRRAMQDVLADALAFDAGSPRP